LPAHHLVGGLRQWTEDVWSACSPAASLLSDLPGYPEPVVRTPLQDGLTVAHDSGKSAPRRETWAARTADNSMHRVLRGSSVHMAASFSRLTYRDAQLETNVNPDVGFRCVKVIWPSRSH
jgi:formylglycine-generating enzyme required for sulfatase activity